MKSIIFLFVFLFSVKSSLIDQFDNDEIDLKQLLQQLQEQFIQSQTGLNYQPKANFIRSSIPYGKYSVEDCFQGLLQLANNIDSNSLTEKVVLQCYQKLKYSKEIKECFHQHRLLSNNFNQIVQLSQIQMAKDSLVIIQREIDVVLISCQIGQHQLLNKDCITTLSQISLEISQDNQNITDLRAQFNQMCLE